MKKFLLTSGTILAGTLLLLTGAVWGVSEHLFDRCFVVERPVNCPDAIAVLAGEHTQRIGAAVELYRRSPGSRILLTNDGERGGWSKELQRTMARVERSEQLLMRFGIPRSAIIILEFRGNGTVHDACAVRDYARKTGITRMVLVTSDYHTKRSLWIFRKKMRDLPVDIGIYPVASPRGVSHLVQRVRIIILEPLKYGYYRLRYRSCRI